MASTLKVNTIDTQSGSTITVPTGKTLAVTDTGALTIGGTAITTGSSNILRKVADYTIVTGDVTAKSELVITANAAAANRTITLPAVAASGVSTCIITIVADAAATGAFNLKVQDSSSTEVWTGYEKSDYVRLIVSNSVWVVLDHKETYFSHRYLTANHQVTNGASTKMPAMTSITDIGGLWNTTDHRIVMPFAGVCNVHYFVKASAANKTGASTAIKAGTAGSPTNVIDTEYSQGNGYHRSYNSMGTQIKLAATEVIEFWVRNSQSDSHSIAHGGVRSGTQMSCEMERIY